MVSDFDLSYLFNNIEHIRLKDIYHFHNHMFILNTLDFSGILTCFSEAKCDVNAGYVNTGYVFLMWYYFGCNCCIFQNDES